MALADDIIQKIRAEAVRQGLQDPDLAVAVAMKESSLKPWAWGDGGASLGLFQLQRAAAMDAGIDPTRRQDVDLNIRGGVTYLKQKLAQSGGNVEQALRRYNSGTPTFKGLGDPRYVERTLAIRRDLEQPAAFPKYGAEASSPLTSVAGRGLQMVQRAITPASAEAATPVTLDELRQALGPARPTTTPPPGGSDPVAASEVTLDELRRALGAPAQPTPSPAASEPAPGPWSRPAPAQAPSAAPAPQPPPAPAPAAAPAAASSFDPRAFAAQELARLQQEETQRLGNWRIPAATGISAGSAMLGTAAGTLVAPFTGPLAPAMPLVGEMAGSYLGRQANIALGLEEGQPWAMGASDIAAVGAPALFGGRQVVQDLRAGVRPSTVPTGAAERVAAAGEAKVPLTYGEAVDSPMAKRAETLLEQVPLVGTSGFRQRQQAAVKEAAQTQITAQHTAMQQTPWRGLAEAQAAAQQGSKQAQNVVDEIAQAGDDWSKIVQASGNLNAWRVKQVANRLYGKVGALAEPLGNVPLTKTVAVLDDTLKELRTAVVPDTETIRYLEQIKSGLQGQTQTIISPPVDEFSTATTKTITLPGKQSYEQLRRLRSDLGDTISDYYKGSNAVVGAKGVGSLAKVRTALEQDLDTFALQSPSPELQAAARQADTYYKERVVPYEDTQLARAMTSNTPDEIYGKFIQRGHGDRAAKFYQALDPKGKAAVQYGMIAEAQQKALDPTTGVFSPKKFATSLETIQDAYGVFFKGQEKWKVDGLLKVMRAAERAGQFAENPPTGNKLIPLLLGGGAVAIGPEKAVLAAAGAKAVSWLLTSPLGTRILLNAHRAGETTFAMDNVLRELTTQGARVLGTELGEGLTEGTQVQVEPGRVGR